MFKPIEEKIHPTGMGGWQKIYRFDNGYGASVVCTPFTYGGDAGLMELAVIKFAGDDWSLNYDTPITNDVTGWLDDNAVERLLEQIAALVEDQDVDNQ
jgi:hypothetical protein